MSDDIDYAEPVTRKRIVQRERSGFQPVAIAYIRLVLTKPSDAWAIINESELTQNARARAKARGAIPGVSDIIVMQMGRVAFLELKWGANKPSDAQLAFKVRMATCDIPVAFCWTCEHIFEALQREQFHLHANAWNLAREYQERAEGAVRRAEIRAQKPHAKQRSERPTQSKIRRFRHVLPGMNER